MPTLAPSKVLPRALTVASASWGACGVAVAVCAWGWGMATSPWGLWAFWGVVGWGVQAAWSRNQSRPLALGASAAVGALIAWAALASSGALTVLPDIVTARERLEQAEAALGHRAPVRDDFEAWTASWTAAQTHQERLNDLARAQAGASTWSVLLAWDRAGLHVPEATRTFVRLNALIRLQDQSVFGRALQAPADNPTQPTVIQGSSES